MATIMKYKKIIFIIIVIAIVLIAVAAFMTKGGTPTERIAENPSEQVTIETKNVKLYTGDELVNAVTVDGIAANDSGDKLSAKLWIE